MIKNICLILFFVGIIIIVFGGGVPTRGFKDNKKLMSEYKKSKTLGEIPTLDQQSAYCTIIFYKIGGWMIAAAFTFHFFI